MKDMIGPYQLIASLGEGGMGVVWHAVHQTTKQLVALKTVKLANHKLLRGIRSEIQALAGLAHPGIVQIVDNGVEDGLPWYAMQFIEGQDLRQWRSTLISEEAPSPGSKTDHAGSTATATLLESALLTNSPQRTSIGRLPLSRSSDFPGAKPGAITPQAGLPLLGPSQLQEIITVIRRVCETLSFLHGEGLIHRDLKPDNILVRPNGTPVLLDFGISTRPMQNGLSRENLVIEHEMAGTAYYISPEQAQDEGQPGTSEARTPDARADLYSLGVILFELLTGERPFQGTTITSILQAHRSQEPSRPSSLVAGIPPSLDDLVLRLLSKRRQDRPGYAQDVALFLGRLGATGWPDALPAPRNYLYRPLMFGREAPLLRLDEALSVLETERGGLLLVGGESGIGKTRLLNEFTRGALQRGHRVLSGESQDRQLKLPLSVFRKPLQTMVDLCRERGPRFSDAVFGRRGKVLSLYEPSIASLPGQEKFPEEVELPSKDALQRLFSYLTETLVIYSGDRPLILVLDDLQWVDALSLAFLQSFAKGTFSRWILMVGTYRTEETSPALQSFLQDERVTRLTLGRLEEAGLVKMLEDTLALSVKTSGAVRALSLQLMKHSEGNPFFVAEYLKAAVEELLLWRDREGHWQVAQERALRAASVGDYGRLVLPNNLRALVARRLERLPAELRDLLTAAALVGKEMPVALLEELHGAKEAPRLLRELVRRQVFEECEAQIAPAPQWQTTDAKLRFVHDKLREVTEERIAPEERPGLHRKVALALEKIFGADAVLYQAELGRHWEQAGETQRAKRCYLSGARYAAKIYNHQEAERLYLHYLSLVPTPNQESITARNELGEEVLEERGRMEEAAKEYLQAMAEARAASLPMLEIQSMRLLGTVQCKIGKVAEALDLLTQALNLSRQVRNRHEEGLILGQFASLHRQKGNMEAAQPLYEQALLIHRQVGDRRSEGICLGNFAILYHEQGRMKEARALYEQALFIHREVGNRRMEGVSLGNVASLYQEQGNFAEARALYEQALLIQRETGNRRIEGIYLNNLACLHTPQEEAHTLYEQALFIHREVGNRRSEGICLGNYALFRHEQGDMKEARALYAQALLIHREVDNRRFEGVCLGELAMQERWEYGDLEATESYGKQTEALLTEVNDTLEMGGLYCLQGHLLLWRGLSAKPILERVVELVREIGASNESELGKKLQVLSRAEEAFARGEKLFRGQLFEDILTPIQTFLKKTGQYP
jgi:serine/threonine protein kinase/tetratricopeptide (TPR) repeat protein